MISPTSFSGTLESSRPAAGRASRVPAANPASAQDAELVRRFNAGDSAAFVEIVARYRGKMFAVALTLLRNRADAEEVAQDTFVRAHRGLAGFRGDSSLATWLHRITFNLARNRYWYFYRRHRHQTLSFDCPLNDGNKATFADFVASDTPDPAREAVNSEFFQHVGTCMEKLGAHQREILTLRNLMDRSYEEIAETLGLSLGTVKSRIARARKNLRELLADTYVEPGEDEAPGQWFESSRPSGHLACTCN